MLPIKRILCPTDFSSPSLEGLKAANELAHHFSAELVVLHVNPPIPVMPEGHGAMNFNIPEYQKEMERAANEQIGKVVERWVTPGVKATARVAQGDPAEEVAAAAAETKADLIVMSTHGRTGWRRFVTGSVTEKVVRLAELPVLTVHFPYEED
jgi:nucleotide-binding universal stress UspA family protein